MKNILTILIGLLSILTTFGQDKKCCDTYVYEGYILTDQNKKLEINLNFLVLLDSTMVGSYYYDPNWGSLKLVGQLNPDFTFYLVEHDKTDSITGFFEGKLNPDYKLASGKWTDRKKQKVYDFEIKQVVGKSYWDYIEKNRALYEYKKIKLAIKEFDKVLSIDVDNQKLKKIPKQIEKLKSIVSFNLGGNNFEKFPKNICRLTSLDELSMSSSGLTYVSPEIGKLKNLRILILNFNQIKSLPKEIGNLSKLLYLELGNNQLTSLPEEVKYLTNLQELHIERNNLSETEKQRIKKLLPKCIIHF